MKKLILCVIVLMTCFQWTNAQDDHFRVVFDLTSDDTIVHQMVLRWVNGITNSDPEAEVIVVFYAKSLGMVLKDKSIVRDDVIKLANRDNVQFEVCEHSLRRHKLDKNELLDGVTTVPDAIYEIVARQKDGWGYIKAAR